MLEGLVAWVLNNYLGKYVENLNTDQLSVALLSGKVELENLPLKKDALRHLGLPVEVRAGFIGKVQLQVPVRQIRSAPWLIAIDQLFLVAAPLDLDEWDGAAEAVIAHERKVALLDALEAGWRAQHEAEDDAGYYAASYSSWLTYGTGLLANIVENLQLKINDVHLRYEDALTCAGGGGGAFACGLTAQSLSGESCDRTWARGFTLLSDADPCSFKLLELQNLALYWDPMPVPAGMMAHCTLTQLAERMRGTWSVPHRYVVPPSGASARVRRERTELPLRSRTRPRLHAHLSLDQVQLTLTQRQYNEAVGCVVGLERIARVRTQRASRPLTPVRGHARLWWVYALRCHLPQHTWMDPKPSWDSCLEAGRQARRYVDTCLTLLRHPAGTLPPDVKAAKDDYEWRTPLHLLKALREVAMCKMPKTTPVSSDVKPASSGRSMLVHWFPQWMGWYGTTAETAAPSAPPPAHSALPTPGADLEEEILDVLADSLENNTLLKRDTVFGKFEFTLNKGCLNLCIESPTEGGDTLRSGSPGLELQFSLVEASLESRPRAGALALHVSLGALSLHDRLTDNTLFPIIVAPQGMIREGLSTMNATAHALSRCQPHHQLRPDPLFQLTYEQKPFGINCDYKLWVKSGSVEVVWCGAAAAWARQFLAAPWRSAGRAPPVLPAPDHTRATIINHWEHIMHPHKGERRSWQVELDISAPQILVPEALCEREAAVLLVDFGRLRVANAHLPNDQPPNEDEDETFMTPCSTPPGSLLSPASPPDPPLHHAPLDPANLHTSLYDQYRIELSEMQVLVGRARDNWKYAHTKSTSPLHLLDRFSISLQAERRVVQTADPLYPTAGVRGSLPALVVHLSEQKVSAVRAVLLNSNLLPDDRSHESPNEDRPSQKEADTCSEASDTERSQEAPLHNSSLYMLHFAIDQMSLEVQSRGRSIAEVQVCGVRAAVSARPTAGELSLALSVHSLLLVDALQTYGTDFELLVASHKHLGMDTASGSIRDSEPTSPTSPTSPASPAARAGAPPAPPPHQLHQALYSLYHGLPRNSGSESDRAKSPTWGAGSSGSWHTSSAPFGPGPPGYGWALPGLVDSEALIAVELCFVKGEGNSEDLRIANILFNNLDIIANQETIVELIGFAQRVSNVGSAGPGPMRPSRAPPPDAGLLSFSSPDDRDKEVRTEITFDFHRLGVLVVRAAVVEGALVAKKIAAATVSEARIQATLGAAQLAVEGSLGGVQVVSLCEGGPHARVLSVGHPAQHHQHYHHPPHTEDDKALLFNITRKLMPANSGDAPVVEAGVRVHVASVWYTHSGTFLHELRSCLAEFKQYLANLARSIRAAAQDMALGLVHPRAEGLYLSGKLSQSTEGVSPRRRTTSLGGSLEDTVELDSQNIILSVCVELESPVVVVPRGPRSAQVLVAHLGRMSLTNRAGPPRLVTYRLQVRDISLVTLDVSSKLRAGGLSGSLPQLYEAAAGRPVLHDSALQLTVAWTGDDHDTQCEVVGKVVGGLQVSARREQYEQIVETLRTLATPPAPTPAPAHAHGNETPHTDTRTQRMMESEGYVDGIALLEPAVPTLQLDPQLRAAVLAVPPPPHLQHDDATHTPLNVKFCVGCVRVELRADLGTGERSLVQLAFREFALRYKRVEPHLTTLQVSLYSVTMEDLTKDPDSKHRLLLVSHTARGPAKAVFLSKSSPDLVTACPPDLTPLAPTTVHAGALPRTASLPAHLHTLDGQGVRDKRDSKCGVTPPCSPECCEREETETRCEGESGYEEKRERGAAELSGDDNLVWISVQMRDPKHPYFEDKYNKVTRLTNVEFNCLNLVVSIDSWVTVLDFFGVAGDDTDDSEDTVDHHHTGETVLSSSSSLSSDGISSMEMSIRSLSVVLVGRCGEVCRALVSRVAVTSRAEPAAGARTVRARLAALHLSDLTPHAPLWRDRFRTLADQALTIEYHRYRLSAMEAASAGHETSLAVEMGPVTYVHTKRFIAELQAFARDFGLLRRVILQARKKVSIQTLGGGRSARQRLRVRAAASLLVVPAAGRSRAALVAELAALTVDNTFRHTESCSATGDNTLDCSESVEVRLVAVEGVCVWCAVGAGLRVRRVGAPLLPAPATINLTCTINMADNHNIPDMSIEGTLTTLQCVLSPAQYRVVRTALAHNLGEPVDDLTPPVHHAPAHPQQVWTTLSLRLELLDVSVRLEADRPLANVNFIKSRLLVETFSDLSQDIDLVSQEILVLDARFAEQPANRRGNVFSRIVQPLPDHRHAVQAELHARKRGEDAAYTIMVNNMRLMAILDWWEAAMQFILQPPAPPVDADQPQLEEAETRHSAGAGLEAGRMELKLNITDSQLVLVEDASVWDTNAVILKSTTVIRYGWSSWDRPVSCELSDVEVFSCVLGLEEETALAILEPARLTVTVQADRSLHVSMGALNLRLSYHDMRMFAAMLQSLPAQAQLALAGQAPSSPVAEDAPANSVHMRASAGAARLLAARWLPAGPASPAPSPAPHAHTIWPLRALHVSGECVTLCVIDDCLDSDVPLLEVSLSELRVDQDLRKVEEAFEDPLLVSSPGTGAGPEPLGGTGGTVGAGPGGGRLSALLSADYYNRMLSGWEPVVEPWRFESSWEYTLSSSLRLARLQTHVRSPADLSLTVTSALLDLGQLVRRNWTADYYAPQSQWSEASPKGSPAGHRRRAPFVPYALRNRTGHRLWFTTLTVADNKDRWGDLEEERCVAGRTPDDSWVLVRAGDTEPFSFGRGPRAAPGPGAAGALAPSHALHRLAIALDQWTQPDPICVDRVGRFFRNITHKKSGWSARLVLEVSLEGSARKLVSVRSALQLVNHLPHAVEVRADLVPPPARRGSMALQPLGCDAALRAVCAMLARPRAPLASAPPPSALLHPLLVNCGSWSAGSRVVTVPAGESWAAPVSGEPGVLWVRPLPRAAAPPPRPAPLDWRRATLHQPALVYADCSSPPQNTYRFCCAIVRDPFPAERGPAVAGHTLTLLPALRLENLLPVELQYRAAPADDAAASSGVRGALAPSDTRPFHEVNVEDGVELSVKVEGFGWSSCVCVGGAGAGAGGGASFSARLKLRDARARRLYLNARVHHHATDGIKVTVSAAYWLVNRTGLPLVFRAEGGAHDAAGQFEEHEVARAVAPLMFCFAGAEGGPTVSARLGRDLAGNGTPEWCSPFGLGPGTTVKRLVVRETGGEERVYTVGVSVRAGRGRYRRTNIATFAPRYHLHNNTRHRLQFAQKCTATTLSDPGAMATHVTAVAGCYLPWHWARWDRERLLCVRVLPPAEAGGPPLTAWSGGFGVEAPRSLHLACRDPTGAYRLLRVEVAAQGASLFIVVSEAEGAPPPLRIDNYSPVAIMFHQMGCSEECVVSAHGRVRWALPEPQGATALALRAPGGPKTHLPLDELRDAHHLLYQNFIYVVFTATLNRESLSCGPGDVTDAGTLVLEVPLGSTRVVLGRKRYGDRCQLWRAGPGGQLVHEGSSPPQPSDALPDDATLTPHDMVLDIEGPAPRPGRPAALVLRRADGRRASTQTWRLHAGRMACAHANLCLQPDGGLMALKPGSRVVLGLPDTFRAGGGCAGAVPPEQAVAWHTLRPGSGRLEVTVRADGPTRLVRIRDHKEPESGWIEGGESEEEDEKEEEKMSGREWGVSVRVAGVSVSLVGGVPPAELVLASLSGTALDVARAPAALTIAFAVADMQIDNQLLGTPSPVLLYCLPERGAGAGGVAGAPALHAAAEVLRPRARRHNARYFRHFVLALRPIAVRLEERLILKLWWWAAPGEDLAAREEPDEADYETRRVLDELTALHATRYYFSLIRIMPSQIRLSMCTASKLEGELAALKRRLALTLIRFEDAAVELEPFQRTHCFDTAPNIARQTLKHFKEELKWQAAKILGSVDFLGNPLGFVADVSEGVSGLLLEGNVSALLKNVTHGISNSAAKVTESLGDGLERVVSDEAHEETRRRIRSAAPGAHLAAGFRGLGLGILGGMTSLVKHSYEGAAAEGLGGFLTGVGKGLVGTVTKPVIGVLDLAAETAAAVRDTSRRSDKCVRGRVRAPRCVVVGALLPRYCAEQAAGAALLHALSGGSAPGGTGPEALLAYRVVRGPPHDIRALISTTCLRIVTCKHTNQAPHLVMETHLSKLVSCTVVSVEGGHFVELGVRGGGASGGGEGGAGVRRPRVQCDSAELAAWVARHAALARQLHHDLAHTLPPSDTDA